MENFGRQFFFQELERRERLWVRNGNFSAKK